MKHTTHSVTLIVLLALSLGSVAMSKVGSLRAAEPHHTVVPGDVVKWGPAPASLPPGAQAAVLFGNPAAAGPYVFRLKFPSGYTISPHRHSKDEFVTLISGKIAIGPGEKLDRAALTPLPPASFVHLPAGMAHYGWADGEAILQVHGMGPFDVTYVDPKDDPRLKKNTSQ
jgi:hypothetical protein